MDRAGLRATRIARWWIELTWVVALFFSGVFVAAVVFAPLLIRHGVNNVSVTVSADDVGLRALPLTITETTRVSAARLQPDLSKQSLRFRTESRVLLFTVWGSLVPLMAILLFPIYLLRGFLRAVVRGDVFTADNATRLNRLGWVVIAGGVAAPLIERVMAWLVLRGPESGVPLQPASMTAVGPPVLAGLLVLVLAAAWRHGVELERDRDLTV